ncbi:MAG: DinB family protein [Anaerolineales bacterium]
MTMKDRLLGVLEKSRETELEFIANLTEEARNFAGTWKKWSAKDNVAHVNYWEDVRGTRIVAFLRGEELTPLPQYEQANAECYERFADSSWDEVGAFAEHSHSQLVEAVRGMDEEALAGPSTETDERKLWDEIVGSAYSHKLMHYSQFYQEQGQKEEAGQLWSEWAELVSPLDEGPEWQGNVHYNAACSLALAGDAQGALLELRKGLELRPSSKAWSRQDSDLDILHDLPEYKELYAPAYWWEALEANAQAEAVADQFLRTLSMLRIAVSTFPESEWRVGESLYQRPASLALHIVQSIDFYSALKPGDSSEDPLTQINWEERNSSKLPSQEELLGFLDKVEERLANFIAKSDFQAEEKLFLWTGFTVLSRAMYNLRHTQHHLADMAMELQRRGLTPPDWQ